MKDYRTIRRWLAALLILGVMTYTTMLSPKSNTQNDIQLSTAIVDGVEFAGSLDYDLTDDQRRGEALISNLPIPVEDMLGSLAPIALSPFFALTCLSGASLLGDTGVLPSSITENFMMSDSSPLNDPTVFLALLGLTVLTSLPKLTKVSKPVGEAVDILESYSGIVAAVAIQMVAVMSAEQPETTEVALVVYNAGIITVSLSTLLSIFSAINIFVINAVRFFFELMVWISPFPTVDALFEAANKSFTAFLIGLYLFNPYYATIVNLILFFLCALIFSWSYRRVVFMRSVLLDPFLGALAQGLHMVRQMTATSTKLPRAIADELPNQTAVMKAFAGKKMKGIAKKSRGYFVHSDNVSYFVKPRMFRRAKIVELSREGLYPSVEKGLLSNGIVFRDSAGDKVNKILITKRYNDALSSIQAALNVKAEIQGSSSLKSLGADLAQGIRADRNAVRSEFA